MYKVFNVAWYSFEILYTAIYMHSIYFGAILESYKWTLNINK